jgi:hypothetical protein
MYEPVRSDERWCYVMMISCIFISVCFVDMNDEKGSEHVLLALMSGSGIVVLVLELSLHITRLDI